MPDAEKKMLTEKEYQYAKQRSYCYINNSKLRVGLRFGADDDLTILCKLKNSDYARLLEEYKNVKNR